MTKRLNDGIITKLLLKGVNRVLEIITNDNKKTENYLDLFNFSKVTLVSVPIDLA